MDLKNSYNKDRRYFVSFLSIGFTSIVLILIGYVLSFVPNKLNEPYIISNYNISLEFFVAKQSEKLQYMVLTVLCPLLFFVFYKVIDSINFKINIQKINKLIYPISLIIASVLFYITFKNHTVYLKNLLIKDNVIIFLIISSIIFALILLYEYYNKISNITNFVMIGIIIISIIMFALLYVCRFYSAPDLHHFDAYFYPVYKVYSGQTILVDFNCLYGFYPYFMVPVLKLMGGVTIFNFSVMMSMLVAITFSCLSYVVWKLCKNKVIATLACCSIMYVPGIFSLLVEPSSYYLQYTPHRIFFPSIILAICVKYLFSKALTKKIILCFGYAISIMSILWNMETGVVVTAVWLLFLLFTRIIKYRFNDRRLYIQTLFLVFFTLISVVLAYSTLSLITFIRSGQYFDVMDMISGQAVFYGSGFYMLHMPLWHPWILVGILYFISLAKSIRNIAAIRKGNMMQYNKIYTVMYFVLPVMGLGIFSYYTGRSHDYCFIPIVYPAIILAAMFMQEYISKLKYYYVNKFIKKKRNNLNSEDIEYLSDICAKEEAYGDKTDKVFIVTDTIKLVCLGTILILFLSSFFYNYKYNSELDRMKHKKVNRDESISRCIEFINRVNPDKNPIDLIMDNAAYISCEMNMPLYAQIPATIDWFAKKDYSKTLNWLSKTNNIVVFDEHSMGLLNRYNGDEIKKILSDRFELISQLEGIYAYKVKLNKRG